MKTVALLLSVVVYLGCANQRNAQFMLPASYNHRFYDSYQDAARSFYAAHVGHFGVYEVLLNSGPDAAGAMAELESRIRELVVTPPRFEPVVDVIAPVWSNLSYETAYSMEWTHMLHSQLYDILSDPTVVDKRTAGERAISYYLTRSDAAYSTRGYGHAFMLGGGDWAETFKEKYPGINGILWGYHWHHAAVYEALMEETDEARTRELDRVIRTFRDSVLNDPPEYMPLTAEVAPRFSKMFPAAAHIFDNLHMMHDVVNDILAESGTTTSDRRIETLRMLRLMLYAGQDSVVAPMMDMAGREMVPPVQLDDGTWLPQGHPDARRDSTSGGHRGH